MNKQLSTYLDALRFLAAVSVFFAHAPGFMGGMLWQLGGGGHHAVVFFFVVSGFVISFVTATKEKDARTYAVNRLARIYSVAGPAIVLTTAAYYFIGSADPEAFGKLEATLYDPVTTLLSALFFLNQSWREVIFFTNGPYWSLGYEVPYYAFFGVLLFARGVPRTLGLVAVLAVMGPSVALYLPVWLLGVFCHRSTQRKELPLAAAFSLFGLSLALFFFVLPGALRSINAASGELLAPCCAGLINMNARSFAGDYLMAALVAANFIAFAPLGRRYRIFGPRLAGIVRELSSHTFSIYLYHMPLLYIAGALYPHDRHPLINAFACLVVVPLLIYGLSLLTENKKHVFRFFFERRLAARFS